MITAGAGPRVAAIIAAWNEADVLDQTLASLAAATPPADRVLVVADHCNDETAEVARRRGALLIRHDTGSPGKGAALAWAVAQSGAALADCPVLAVFDADTRVSPLFFAEIRKAFRAGARAVQGYISPVDVPDSPAIALAAYSEVLGQRIDSRLCAWLGGSVRLRGTGMALEAKLLSEILPQVRTQVEDIELTLLVAERGVRILSVPAAVVYDPKPANLMAASRQRSRWFRGQFEVLRVHPASVRRLLRQGPRGWWLLQDIWLKPRTLIWTGLALAAGLACLFAFSPWSLGALLAIVGLAAVYYLGGLLLLPASQRRLYGRALPLAPLFAVMWLLSAITAWSSGRGWLRVRDNDQPG